MIVQTKEEQEILREGGKRLAHIFREVSKAALPGITTKELDVIAEKLILEGGDTPAFLGYQPDGAKYPFPASLCTSINDEVVHGIPAADRILKKGDIISLDLGLKHRGLFTDAAITIPVGKVDADAEKLLGVTKGALLQGIAAVRAGSRIGDISSAIENSIKPHGFGILEVLCGHGVGKSVHEDPYVPNFGKTGTGEKLAEGLVIAIEPMVNLGTKNVKLNPDGYTYRTADGSRSAHFEHTVLVTKKGAEILTI